MRVLKIAAWALALLLVLLAAAALWISQQMVAPKRLRVSETTRPVLGVHLKERDGPGVDLAGVASPARESGLRAGDRIVALDGEPIERIAEVPARLREMEPGQLVRVEARRPQPDGREGGVLVDVPVDFRPISPADLGLPYHEVSFENPWGLNLRGWYVPPPSRESPGSAPGIVFGHGNGTDRRQWLDVAFDLHQAGFAQLLFDFAGRGESDGEVITLGERESGDLTAALEFLASRPEVDGSRLALAGRSMGAAAAILAAAEGAPVRALVLDSPFTDLPRLADEILRGRFLPSWPLRPLGFRLAGWRADYNPELVRPIDSISKVRVPILLLHATEDRVISISHADELRKAAGGPVHMVPVEGLGHNDSRPAEVRDRVAEFLRRNVAGSR